MGKKHLGVRVTIENIKIAESLNACDILYFADIPCAECFGLYSNMDMLRDMSEDSDNVLFDGDKIKLIDYSSLSKR